MTSTNISDFKAHLSENLRKIKSGKTIILLERETPIAKIMPYHSKPLRKKLTLRKATGKLIDMKLDLNLKIDPATYLSEDRDER